VAFRRPISFRMDGPGRRQVRTFPRRPDSRRHARTHDDHPTTLAVGVRELSNPRPLGTRRTMCSQQAANCVDEPFMGTASKHRGGPADRTSDKCIAPGTDKPVVGTPIKPRARASRLRPARRRSLRRRTEAQRPIDNRFATPAPTSGTLPQRPLGGSAAPNHDQHGHRKDCRAGPHIHATTPRC